MCSIDVTSPCGQYLKSYTPVQTQIIFSGVGYTESMNMGLHGDIFELNFTDYDACVYFSNDMRYYHFRKNLEFLSCRSIK